MRATAFEFRNRFWVICAVFAAGFGGLLVVVLRLIGREEAALSGTQGSGYAEYRMRVPRLWPSLLPRVPASGARPAWRQAILGELMMWAFALGAGAFAMTLERRLLYLFLILGFLGYFPGVRARRALVVE
jgi:hypothetical protein